MASNGCEANTGKVERSQAKTRGRSVSVMRKGEVERDGERKTKRKRQSTSRDFVNKKARSLRTKYSRGKNMLHERESESQRRKMFTKICFFFQEGTCTKGDFCTFSHDVTNEREQVERRLDAAVRREDPGVEVLYLRDKTFTVKTLGIKEHFSKFGDVVKVMFIGKQGGGNLFKVVVNNGAWKPRRKKVSHYTTICGVQMEVESKGQNSTMSRRDSSSSWTDRSPSSQSHTIGETSSRSGEERGEYSGNWSGRLEKRRSRIDARALGIWRERRADQEWQASVVMEGSSVGETSSDQGGVKVDKNGGVREETETKEKESPFDANLVSSRNGVRWSPYRGNIVLPDSNLNSQPGQMKAACFVTQFLVSLLILGNANG